MWFCKRLVNKERERTGEGLARVERRGGGGGSRGGEEGEGYGKAHSFKLWCDFRRFFQVFSEGILEGEKSFVNRLALLY